jgi:membrane protein implicated in regulation of membrane protease activity
MFRKGLAVDIAVFLLIVLFLLWVIPAISSLLKQLFYLQLIIFLAGAIVLRILVQKIRKRMK